MLVKFAIFCIVVTCNSLLEQFMILHNFTRTIQLDLRRKRRLLVFYSAMTLPCLNLTTDVTPLPSAPTPTPGEVALVNDELLQNATNPVGPIILSGGLVGWLKEAGVAKED